MRELAEAMALSPQQRWGAADGQPHDVTDGQPNQEPARSLQSKYPRIEEQRAAAARNEAEVKQTGPDVRGFDAVTSKELPDRREARSRTFDNADGTQTTEFSQSEVNYRKPDGSWAPIDTKFVGTNEGWRNAADQVDLRLASRASAGDMVRLRLDDQHEVAFGLQGTSASAGVAAGNTVTYPGVLPGVDLRFEAQPGGVKEVMVLESADAPHSWTFPLRLKGLTAKVDNDQVLLLDRDGNERGRFPRGFMTDSSVDPRTGDPALSYGVKYQIDGQNLKVELDSAWLRDPARKYPVLVDPTIEARTATSSAFYQGTWKTDGSSELKVGNSGGLNSAAYLDFGGVENSLRNHKIHGAALALTNYWSWSCNARPVTIHPVTGPWNATGYPGPAVGPAITESSFAHGYIGAGETKSNCPTAVEQINLGVAGRDLIQRWVNGEQVNYGLSVRASESDTSGWKKFTGHKTANPPRLYITHTPYNAEYRFDRANPEPPVHAEQGGSVKITVTNRGAQTWTPSTFAFGYRAFTDRGSPVRAVEAAQLPHDVPRGGSVTLDARIDALAAGDYLLDFSMLRKGGPWFTDEQIPPARLSLRVYNVPPVIKAQYPPNGYSSPTLTPQLWVDAVDVDSKPDKPLQYRFEVCENFVNGSGVNCVDSGRINTRMWTVPKDSLRWSKNYQWRAFAYDGNSENPALPPSFLLTSVPQPNITARLANAPYNGANKAFDPQTGNYFSSAIDVSVTSVGPELSVARTYNSLDPRRDLAFGAGWSTRWDMRVVPDNDGSGNVVVSLADGQQVRFGRNPGGGFSPPPGRTVNLHAEPAEFGGGWIMVDQQSTSYRFRPDGRLTRIVDQTGQWVDVGYTSAGQLAQVVSKASGRKLTFTWAGEHVRSVSTDAVGGKQLTWTYDHDGDKLTKVCDPTNGCTRYEYDQGSHYRSAVADSIPGSYWRLGDPEGTKLESQVRTNLGKDDGVGKDVTWAPGAIQGSPDGARTFNGTSSSVKLPAGLIKKNRDLAVEMWFKTTSGGPLLGMQHFEFGSATTPSVPSMPVLWVGTDGKLRGNFWNGKHEPVATSGAVNDDQWHHVVLSGSLGLQSLFLDGALVGTVAGEIDHLTMTHNQLGAAFSETAWAGWTPGTRYFSGALDEVAFYEHAIGTTAAKQHFEARKPSDQLTKITLPSGRLAASMSYDVVTDRMREYVDRNGGRWQLSAPVVTGVEQNLVRTAQVTDPGNRFHYFDYDPARGRILRSLAPLGQGVRPEDLPAGDPVPPGSDPWTGGPNRGQGVRTYDYDDNGHLSKITDENGNQVHLTNDDRGNPVTRKTCRIAPEDCQTSYFSYYYNPSDFTDPRNGKVLTSSDGRSSGPDDTKYRTSFTYSGIGQRGLLETKRYADGSAERHTYTDGSSVGPAGLVETTRDTRDALTSYAYYPSGDLERVTNAAGLVTKFAYDALGRKTSQTEISRDYPQGLTTTYTYDDLSRQKSVTRPATTNKVTGVKHTERTSYEYDADGNVTAVEMRDLTGGDPVRRTISEYDDRGRVKRVVDAEGNETSSGYDDSGNIVWTVDAVGTKTEFAYTARNKVAEVRLRAWHGDPIGPGGPGGDGEGDATVRESLVVTAYAYDVAGRLTRSTDAMGRTKRYEYYQDDSIRRVLATKVRDPFDSNAAPRDVVLEANTYDKAGNLATQVSAGGLKTEWTYDVLNRTKTVKADPQGIGRTTTYDYDAGGNVTRVAVEGKPSNSVHQDVYRTTAYEYGYDAAGRRSSETSFNGTERLTTSSVYDERGLLRSVTDPRGTAAGADRAAFTAEYGYDEGGRAVSAISPQVQVEVNGTVTSSRPSVHAGLDTSGGTTEFKDANGNIAKQAFDKLGRVVRVESPEYIKPGAATAARAVTLTEYWPTGEVRKVTNPRGAVTEYRYDQLRRLAAVYLPDPDAPGRTKGSVNYSYTRAGERLSATGPTGVRAERTYDDLGRPVTSTQLERHPAVAAYTTKMTYDDAGNLKTVTSPSNEVSTFAYDALNQRISSTDPAGVVTKLGYDSAGRQSRTSDGLNRTSFQTYDTAGRPSVRYQLDANEVALRMTRNYYDRAGNVVKTTDPHHRATTYTYDAQNRLVSQVEPVADDRTITTSFGYDAAGNLSRFTDGRGNATRYRANSLGLPESTIEPPTAAHPNEPDRTWTVGYDLAGNPENVALPGGVTRTRTFDLRDRLVKETGAGAEATTADRINRYDDAGRLVGVNAPGGDNVFEYNDRGALLSATGPSGDSKFAYDESGRPTSRTDASGTAKFTYLQGRLSTIQDGLSGAGLALGYNEAGQLKTTNFGGGKVRELGYDAFGRLESDNLRDGTNTISSINYGYELNDLLKRKTTTGLAGSGEHTYAYDYAGRMKSWTYGGKTTAYEWDDSGNRVKADGKTSTYDARNRLESDGDKTYTWSARGTLQAAGSNRYEFDAFDRSVKRGSQVYSYDGLDRMVLRGDKKFSYLGTGLDVVSDGTSSYSRDASGDLLSTQRGLALTDQHGDVLAEFSPSGERAGETTTYDPFGKVQSGARTGLGFQGDWTDPDSGEVDMGARWYSPSTGGFTARDSIPLPTAPSVAANRYAYGQGAPATYTDPDGHWAVPPAIRDVARKAITGGRSVARTAGQVGRYVGPVIKSGGRFVPGVNAVINVYDFYQFVNGKPETSAKKKQIPLPSRNQGSSSAAGWGNLFSQVWSLIGSFPSLLRMILAGIKWPGGSVPAGVVPGSQTSWDPSVAARAEAEDTAKNEALDPPAAANQPIVESGTVSSNADTPASQVAVQTGGSQDANEVVRQVRDAVVGTDSPVIKEAAEQNPSELSGSSDLRGVGVQLEGACYVGGQERDDGSRGSMIWEGCDGSSVRRSRDASGQWVKDPYGPPTDHNRSTEYPSGYRQGTHDALATMWTDEGRAQGGVPVDKNGNRIPRADLHWRDEFDELIPYEELTYEHLHSVVEHWNTTGYNTPRKVRNDWYNQPPNLTPMTRSDNSRGGANIGAKMRYRQDTGPDYSAF